MNNPLSFTDPTGFSRWTNFRDRYGRTILAVGAAFVIGPFVSGYASGLLFQTGTFGISQSGMIAASAWGNVVGGAAAGFAAGGIQGGNLNSALQGAVSGSAFGIAGQFTTPGEFESFASHAAAGCASASAAGGSCSSGAAGALAGKLVTNFTIATLGQSQQAHFAATVIGGGLGSKAAGGTFEGGAFTAALGYLLNFKASKREVKIYDPLTKEIIEVENRYVVSFCTGCTETDGSPGYIGEKADKFMLRGQRIMQYLGKFADFITPDSYGTADLGSFSAKEKAYRLDPGLEKIFKQMNLNSDFGGINAGQMRTFLDAAAQVPSCTETYGSTSSIFREIQKKFDGSK